MTAPVDVAMSVPGISLDELVQLADLQDRFDTKYLVPLGHLGPLIGRFAESANGDIRVLDIGGQRVHGYRSEYFDTPDLRLYRDHVQRRRRRYKVRTRRYEGDVATYFEVKLKVGAGRTSKYRMRHDAPVANRLGDSALTMLDTRLAETYGIAAPAVLTPAATVCFDRVTVVVRDADGVVERVTIDTGLEVSRQGVERPLGESHAIVEVKARRPHALAGSVLVSSGFRPLPVSKYCLAVASTAASGRSHPWIPVLRVLQRDVSVVAAPRP